MSDRTSSKGADAYGRHWSITHYLINAGIQDRTFDPDRLLRCLTDGEAIDQDSEQSGRWYSTERIVEPDALVRFVVERHEDSGDVHYHLLITVDLDTPSQPATRESLNWNQVVECLAQVGPAELQCSLITRAEFDAARWRTVLSLPRTASGLLPNMGEDEIVLSGVELNFSRTSLPLDDLFVSFMDDEYFVAVRYQRTLRLREISGVELLAEAEELAKTFVVEKASEGKESDT